MSSECDLLCREILWGQIFNNTISNSQWLIDKSFSPGRFGVGYAYLYVLYRILSETKPTHIIDFGLGQTSKMISQYACFYPNAHHTIIESDKQWCDWYLKTNVMPQNSQIRICNYSTTNYNGADVRTFDDLDAEIGDTKFDLISIDAPLGYDMPQYSRIDVLRMIPQNINTDFAIIIDDTNRRQEMNTVNEIIRKLRESNIRIAIQNYRGQKDCMVITSEKWHFLTTM